MSDVNQAAERLRRLSEDIAALFEWVSDEEFTAHCQAIKAKGPAKGIHRAYERAMSKVADKLRTLTQSEANRG